MKKSTLLAAIIVMTTTFGCGQTDSAYVPNTSTIDILWCSVAFVFLWSVATILTKKFTINFLFVVSLIALACVFWFCWGVGIYYLIVLGFVRLALVGIMDETEKSQFKTTAYGVISSLMFVTVIRRLNGQEYWEQRVKFLMGILLAGSIAFLVYDHCRNKK